MSSRLRTARTWLTDNLGWRRRAALFAFMLVALLVTGNLIGALLVAFFLASILIAREDDPLRADDLLASALILLGLAVTSGIRGSLSLGRGHEVSGGLDLLIAAVLGVALLKVGPLLARQRRSPDATF